MTTPEIPMTPDLKTPTDEPEAPKVIYLQDGCEDPECVCRPDEYEGVTWCSDQINANDTKYIRFDAHEAELATLTQRLEGCDARHERQRITICELHEEIETITGNRGTLAADEGLLKDADALAARLNGKKGWRVVCALRERVYELSFQLAATDFLKLTDALARAESAQSLVTSLSEALRELVRLEGLRFNWTMPQIEPERTKWQQATASIGGQWRAAWEAARAASGYVLNIEAATQLWNQRTALRSLAPSVRQEDGLADSASASSGGCDRASGGGGTLCIALRHLPELVTLDVSEIPDRNSPDDWPEAMIVTDSELRQIVSERVEDVIRTEIYGKAPYG